ncbi:sulfite exporter TauE/SafE family protein [Shinella kummerowiae]|uniref:sulfite exporter TauE/SafE family protein n=1 Tax=Shinella kummerowiae TaxID=417745 RepID=UPI0019251A6F|nr:sulfite exporter TauE/SafE family protein [Shinella kummerowiae]
MIDWQYSLLGLFVGAFVGITGVGGGSLMTPILVLFFGIHPIAAVGTDLLYAAITKLVGTVVHARKQTVNWTIVRLLATGSIPGALLTIFLISSIGKPSGGAANLIVAALGFMLVLTSVLLIFQKQLLLSVERWGKPPHANISPQHYPWPTVAVGFIIGVLVTLTSVGAGALGATMMLILYPRLRLTDIVGSDIAHAVPLALIGGIGYWAMGGVDWSLLTSLLAGSIPGIIVGSLLATSASDRFIRPMLAAVLAVIGMKLILSS